jgi:hypothetical protein
MNRYGLLGVILIFLTLGARSALGEGAPPAWEPPMPSAESDVAADWPILQPEMPSYQLPGTPWAWWPFTDVNRERIRRLGYDPVLAEGGGGYELQVTRRNQVIEEQLHVIEPELDVWNSPHLLSGVGQVVLRLSAPSAPPRAIVILREGPLYLVEKKDGFWRERRLVEFEPEVTQTLDLTGDGQPEVVAARHFGSGGHLALEILGWDESEVRTLFRHSGASEPGQFGFFDAEGDGIRELWIDTAATHGLFPRGPTVHGPFLRDRYVFRWEAGAYRPTGHFRYSTPFYHINRFLWFARHEQWRQAARHLESGAVVDRSLARTLAKGDLGGGDDTPFVNGRMLIIRDQDRFVAEFGATGRLLRLERQDGDPPDAE